MKKVVDDNMTTKRTNRDNTTVYSSNTDMCIYIYTFILYNYMYIYIHISVLLLYTVVLSRLVLFVNNYNYIIYVYIYIYIQTRQTRTSKNRSYEKLQSSSAAKWHEGSLAPHHPLIMWVCLRI